MPDRRTEVPPGLYPCDVIADHVTIVRAHHPTTGGTQPRAPCENATPASGRLTFQRSNLPTLGRRRSQRLQLLLVEVGLPLLEERRNALLQVRMTPAVCETMGLNDESVVECKVVAGVDSGLGHLQGV